MSSCKKKCSSPPPCSNCNGEKCQPMRCCLPKKVVPPVMWVPRSVRTMMVEYGAHNLIIKLNYDKI